MAGQGFKDFAVGEVLTSADVDGYLMQQSVMRFADSAARGSALGTATGTAVPLAEGMVSYLDDQNRIEVYTGTGWTPAGKVLQVVSTTKTNLFTVSSTSYTDITGLSVTITPTSTASSVLLLVSIGVTDISVNDGWEFRTVRDSTAVFVGNDVTVGLYERSGAAWQAFAISFVDSPATTSAVTYKLQTKSSSGTVYVNGSSFPTTAGASSITAIEVAG